jgi:hypothetical protein
VVFAGATAVAVLGLPAAGESIGVVARPAAVSRSPDTAGGIGALLGPAKPAPAPPTSAAPDPGAPTAADREAGILRRVFPRSGSGVFDVVAGSSLAPGAGEVHAVRVEVEHDLPVDHDRFATFVLSTLNDPRGWAHGGAMTFARTDGDAPMTVLLASPDTSARLCEDLDSGGLLSCRNGAQVVLTVQRWVDGTDEYAGNLTGYRQYLVNHEVGHWLGHSHERCPAPGAPAPVMQQQTLGLKGCRPNSWPYPDPAAP